MTIRTVLVVPVDSPPWAWIVDVGKDWLEWLYQTCETRIIEHVDVARGVGVYGDEEGRLHGKEVNRQATALVAALMEQDGDTMYDGWDLVGTIVFVGDYVYTDDEGNGADASVPDRVLDLVSLNVP